MVFKIWNRGLDTALLPFIALLILRHSECIHTIMLILEWVESIYFHNFNFKKLNNFKCIPVYIMTQCLYLVVCDSEKYLFILKFYICKWVWQDIWQLKLNYIIRPNQILLVRSNVCHRDCMVCTSTNLMEDRLCMIFFFTVEEILETFCSSKLVWILFS